MRFLLVIPRFLSPIKKSYELPLGIAYISAALKKAGEEVYCLNLNETSLSPEAAIKNAVESFDPDICGSGTLSPFLSAVKTVFAAARAAKPNIINMVGGGVFSGDPELARTVLDIDIGVFGEGEETVVEIAQALKNDKPLTEVAGLLVRENDKQWTKTADRRQIKTIDELPWPDLESFGLASHIARQTTGDNYIYHLEDEPRAVSMIASRSCPYACTFCYHPIGRVYRERSLDDFFAELDHYVANHDINLLAILDELFAVKKDRLKAFCERIKPYGLNWVVQLHVSVVDEIVLDMMKDAGCIYISYGLESMDPGVLKSMKKKASVKQIESALKLTRERRIGIQGNFIFGDPAETLESAANTIDWWASHREFMINLGVIQLYPGTPIYNDAVAKGRYTPDQKAIIDPLLNVTTIDDISVRKMREMLQVFELTLLRPAPISSFDESHQHIPERGSPYDIDWTCPDCGAENHYRNVVLDSPFDHFAIRLTCRTCFSRLDIENLARTIWRDKALEAKCAEADTIRKQAISKGDFDGLRRSIALYHEIASTPFSPAETNRPEAVIQAAEALGAIYGKLSNGGEEALKFNLQAMTYRPFDPGLHFRFAQSLAQNGLFDAARLHARQARALVKPGDPKNQPFLDGVEAFLQSLKGASGEALSYFLHPALAPQEAQRA